MFFDFSKTVAPLLLAVLLATVGCGSSDPPRRAAGKPLVLATTTVVADLVRQVAGDRVEVDCLMAPGIDPHSYRPTPADADRLARADLVVASGLQLEGRLAALLERLGTRRPVLSVGNWLPRDRLLAATDDLFDPHVWFDAGLWSLCPPLVAEALATLDPAGAAAYRERAAAHAAELVALDAACWSRRTTRFATSGGPTASRW